MKGIYILSNQSLIYDENVKQEIEKYVQFVAPPQTNDTILDNLSLLRDVEVIFSGWGCPKMDEHFLSHCPNLKAVFYGSGTIKYWVSDAFWDRGITVTSSYAANAVPVSEFTFAQILLSLKREYYYTALIKKEKKYPRKIQLAGAYGSTVGIISLGMIGKMVCERLKSLDVRVIAYDPFCSEEKAKELGVELCSLEEIFRQADVVSLHAPWIPETVGMITGEHFKMMKQNATFINTSRGAIVKENEMIDCLQERTDLYALLDVTYPEPPAEGSLLYTLENVILTPHIAGSVNAECHRMGAYMLEELRRYVDGVPLKWSISREQSKTMA